MTTKTVAWILMGFVGLATLAAALVLSSAPAPADPRSSDKDATAPAEGAEVQPAAAASAGTTVSEFARSIWVIYHAANGDYWFGSDGQGVFRYDGKSITQYSSKDGLCNDHVREIQEDKAGVIYIGTLNGFSRFDGRRFTTLPVVESSPGEDWRLDPDDLWFKGNSIVNGPYRFDGETLRHLKFPKNELEDEFNAEYPDSPYSPYGVYTIYRDSAGNMWFGTAELGACRYDGDSLDWLHEGHLESTPGGGAFGIRSITEDSDGAFWICNTRYRFIIDSDGSDSKPGQLSYERKPGVVGVSGHPGAEPLYYQYIVRDHNDDLWMSPYGGGVWRYDGEKITHYPAGSEAAPVKQISLYLDRAGELWMGTEDTGVYRFNGSEFVEFRPGQ